MEWDTSTNNGQGILLDMNLSVDDHYIRTTVSNAWSAQRFFTVFNYMKKYMDIETSRPQAQYYCRRKNPNIKLTTYLVGYLLI